MRLVRRARWAYTSQVTADHRCVARCLLLFAFAACSGKVSEVDAGSGKDSGEPADAGQPDAGAPFAFDFIVSPDGGAGAGTLADPWSLAYAIGIGAGTARGDGKLPAAGAHVGLRAGLYSRTNQNWRRRPS